MRLVNYYNATNFGRKEVEMMNTFYLQQQDAFSYFYNVLKPRYDRYYKLYVAYNGDRQREIKSWQANVFVPYVQAVVETMMPRILDARPDFTVIGRSEEDNAKAPKQQMMLDYLWELSRMDRTTEDLVRAALIYGTGFMQVSWKQDIRKLKFLQTKDIGSKKYKWVEKEKTFYDAPFCEWVDNYSLWYDWHNTDRKQKQFWLKRLVLTEGEIIRRYPMADPYRLEMAFGSQGGDLTDYASIRQVVKSNSTRITKDGERYTGTPYNGNTFDSQRYQQVDSKIKMYETFEWTRPYDDAFAVVVGGSRVPILKDGMMPIPYDFKEAPFIEVPYLKVPGEFEGYGIAAILESPQILLNTIKNQRLDAATLSIHKMWIVNPLANINKDELVTRPFGIIYSIDPQGVREVQFSDIKASAYKEEDLLKRDMQYASGVDDASMGVSNGQGSATEIRHLRESTLERVRLFVNHLGDAYADVMRYWIDMERQLFTEAMTIRIVGKDGVVQYPLVEKDDLMGMFDYRASVLPSIAGQQDVQKKQDMDLFQLLIQLPFIDQRKLTSKVLQDWDWSLDSIAQTQEQGAPSNDPNAMAQQGMAAMGGGAPAAAMGGVAPMPDAGTPPTTTAIPPQVLARALSAMHPNGQPGFDATSSFGQASVPINIAASQPPTVKGVPTPNTRGHNRTGKVNTNISLAHNSNPESALQNQAINIQR